MNHLRRQGGFIFIAMLMVVIIVAAVMFSLTHISRSMIFAGDTAYLDAVTADLVAGAAAWASVNGSNAQFQGVETVLDVNDLGYRDTSLRVRIEAADDGCRVEIAASCSKRRRCDRATATFVLPAPAAAPGQESPPRN